MDLRFLAAVANTHEERADRNPSAAPKIGRADQVGSVERVSVLSHVGEEKPAGYAAGDAAEGGAGVGIPVVLPLFVPAP